MTADQTVKGTPVGRSRNGLPGWKPYKWRDPDADREAQVMAILEGVRARLGGPADEPDPFEDVGYEWRREQLAELEEHPAPAAPLPLPVPMPPPTREPAPRCGKCGYLTIRCSCPGGPRG